MTNFETKRKKSEVLGIRQRKALAALMEQPTVEQAAHSCGIAVGTIRRWLSQDEKFRAAVTKIQSEMLDETLRRIAAKSNLAADALERAVVSPDERLAARVAINWLSLARRTRQETRLTELEQAIEQLKNALAEREKHDAKH
jgi:predicted kinase